ncbi:hypothetical protein BJX70DRAFT_393443 [Aspergillus crustosus]
MPGSSHRHRSTSDRYTSDRHKSDRRTSDRHRPSKKPCTTYRSMCSQCKIHYTILAEDSIPESDLVYKPRSYPLVFEHHITIEGPFTATDKSPDTSILLDALSERLDDRFAAPCTLYGHFRTKIEEGKAMHLFMSVLIDFPRKVVPYQEFMEWLFDGLAMAVGSRNGDGKRRVRSDGSRERWVRGKGWERLPREVTPLAEWEVFTPDDEEHLCEARLNWFMMRSDLGHLLGVRP